MTTDLVTWVDQQLSSSGLDDDTGLVVLAALGSDTELDDLLDGGTPVQRPNSSAPAPDVDPGGTFLSSIAVEGFRGIGERIELRLSARPGLTIVAGRNGSGKSSISEALELVLTGDTYRWKSKSSVEWRQQWRNLHHPVARVSARFVEEGAAPVTVSAGWADDESDVRALQVWTQRTGQKQSQGTGALGWARALEQYRPILSYDELGGLLESGRAQLYDALSSILGVEQLSDALKRIQLRLKNHKAPATAATAQRKQLQQEATSLADERADRAAQLLRKSAPDLSALRALATGSHVPETGPLQPLRTLAGLTPGFDSDEVGPAVAAVRAAVAGLATAGSDTSARSVGRLELLEGALRLHAEHGDMTCPVCRTGELDSSWREVSTALAADQRHDLEAVAAAQQTLDLAVGRARRLVSARPAALLQPPDPTLGDVVTTAREAWDRWATVPELGSADAANALAEHLVAHAAALVDALTGLRGAAGARLAELEDVWQPFATRLGAWCAEWAACQEAAPVVAQLAAAEKWLKENDLRLKNERLAPIEDDARAAWAKLRQESNIELGALTLTGSGTQRRVVIDAAVDGTAVKGFTVLSQGELHALALSLFLPRATRAESPFRFLVLDDPIQAMDPAKVDGLVELLSELAATHQVIVFSHDDRLPAAVRRHAVGATVLEVTRGVGSQVSLTVSTDPAVRYIEDARGLVLEAEHDRLTDSAMRRTVPGLLRFAVEAAAKDRFFSARLASGAALDEVEHHWDDAATTRQKVILGVFLEQRQNHELDAWAAPPYRKLALRTVGSSMHSGLKGDVDARQAVKDVERLVNDLRASS